MNAAEHFAEAERLIKASADVLERHGQKVLTLGQQEALVTGANHLIALSQVHATLAVAASQMRSLPAEQAATS